MRQISKLHQVDHTQAVGTVLTQAIGSIFDDPPAGLLPLIFRVTHRLLRDKRQTHIYMIIIIYNNRIPQNGTLICASIRKSRSAMLTSGLNAGYCPTNTGLRLSTKARTASL